MTARLPRRAPADAGLSASAIVHGVRALTEHEGLELNSVMILHRGAVVHEQWWWPASPERIHMLHSATKGFVGIAAVLAIADGALSLSDRVAHVLPEFLPEGPLGHLDRLTVQDLLTMRSGHAAGLSGSATRLVSSSVVRSVLAEPFNTPPGEQFVYSSGSSHLLSAVVHRSVGRSVAEYLAERIFAPLGIGEYVWTTDPDGFCTGGNGLSLRTEDFLKIGALLLNEGEWNGEQLIPRSWAHTMVAPHVEHAVDGKWDGAHFVPMPHEPGAESTHESYGYHWGVLPEGGFYTGGIFGQYCMVFPEQQAVIAVTGSVTEWRHRALPELVRRHLVPVLGLADAGAPMPDTTLGPASQGSAGDTRDSDAPLGHARPPMPSLFGRSEDPEARITAIEIDFGAEGVSLCLQDRRGHHRIRAPYGSWQEARTSFSVPELHHSYEFDDAPVIARSGWVGDALTVRLLYPETAFRDTLTVTVADQEIVLRQNTDVNTGITSLPEQRFARP